jgi:histidinol-phosphate aminotransferase
MQQPWKDIALPDLPLREDLKSQHAYGAPQLDVPVCLNVNENPYPPSAALVERIATAVADAARASGGISDARHRRDDRRIARLGGQRLE